MREILLKIFKTEHNKDNSTVEENNFTSSISSTSSGSVKFNISYMCKFKGKSYQCNSSF